MENTHISGRVLGILGLLVAFINAFYTLTSFLKKDTIVICNEKNGTTIVMQEGDSSPVIASEGISQELLFCIGKSIPYYSREINTLISSKKSNQEVLKDRYHILHENDFEEKNKIVYYDNLFIIDREELRMIVGAKPNTSPFTLEKYIPEGKLVVVYMPVNSPEIDDLARKIVEDSGGEIYMLNSGENVRVPLL